MCWSKSWMMCTTLKGVCLRRVTVVCCLCVQWERQWITHSRHKTGTSGWWTTLRRRHRHSWTSVTCPYTVVKLVHVTVLGADLNSSRLHLMLCNRQCYLTDSSDTASSISNISLVEGQCFCNFTRLCLYSCRQQERHQPRRGFVLVIEWSSPTGSGRCLVFTVCCDL